MRRTECQFITVGVLRRSYTKALAPYRFSRSDACVICSFYGQHQTIPTHQVAVGSRLLLSYVFVNEDKNRNDNMDFR